MKKQKLVPSPTQRGGAGMSREAWLTQQRGRKAVLYVVKAWDEGEAFYKIGITFAFSRQFEGLKTWYKYRTIARYTSGDAGKVYDLEQRLHANLARFCYVPRSSFNGKTECYTLSKEVLEALPSGTLFLMQCATA